MDLGKAKLRGKEGQEYQETVGTEQAARKMGSGSGRLERKKGGGGRGEKVGRWELWIK